MSVGLVQLRTTAEQGRSKGLCGHPQARFFPLLHYSLQYSQPSYLRELFTIQPTRITRSSSCLTLSRSPVTFHLMCSNRAVSITVILTTCHRNSALLLYLHHHHCQSQTIIFMIWILYLSSRAFHSNPKYHHLKLVYPDSFAVAVLGFCVWGANVAGVFFFGGVNR